jgi:hypothetical protein
MLHPCILVVATAKVVEDLSTAHAVTEVSFANIKRRQPKNYSH